mmetsp:Transcript_20166/g.48438  ORF Transcript_20166/g.48438 Transcript_20166/m.48438 type:complete len:243 (-) Transcript_20166:119-847(-)
MPPAKQHGTSHPPPLSRESSEADGTAHLAAKFLVLSSLLAAAIAFSIGAISRIALLSSNGTRLMYHPTTAVCAVCAVCRDLISAADLTKKEKNDMSLERKILLPKIRAFNDNGNDDDVPLTTFTTKLFPPKGSTTSNTVHLDRRGAVHIEEEGGTLDEEEDDGEEDISDDDYLNFPTKQPFFGRYQACRFPILELQERIAQAMVDLIEGSKMTQLLSYHCHSILPIGVSCVGILVKGHSVRT